MRVGGPKNKDHSISGSILEFFFWGENHHLKQGPKSP